MIKHLWKKWICQYTKHYWYRNITRFPINFYKFIKELISFLKKGYPYEAIYCMDWYFIDTFLKILKDYNEHKHGYPAKYDEEEEWTNIVQEMIDCLEKMKENYGEFVEDDFKNKDRFFELFNEHFYELWD